jgi:sulfate adenylyltransferase subunit 1 (EFTu-like GTPase family)
VLLMFVIEVDVRRRVLPQVQRHGLIATLRIYFG